MNDTPQRCPSCGATRSVVHVHGHGQCVRCGANVEPCCAGASASGEADLDGAPELGVHPDLFRRLFAELGGERATVAGDALRYALARWLGVDLDAAAEVLEAGVQLDHLRAAGAGAFRLGPGPQQVAR